MKPMYLPFISSDAEHEAFRAFMDTDIVSPYREWLQGHANRVTNYSGTHQIIEVEVEADDFTRYFNTTAHSSKAMALLSFAELIGTRNNRK